MISTIDIAWAAGFLEGEGHFASKSCGVRISAAQVQREPLDRLASIFGGKVAGPRKTKYKPIYVWGIYSSRCAGIAMTLYTFMSPKRRLEIEALLDRWKLLGPNPGTKTHCKHGHEFSPENTILKNGKHRRCIACNKAHEESRNARRKAARAVARRSLEASLYSMETLASE